MFESVVNGYARKGTAIELTFILQKIFILQVDLLMF